MIIRDNASPRGRDVGPKPMDHGRVIMGMKAVSGYMGEGESWLSLNKSDLARAWLFGTRPAQERRSRGGQTGPRPRVAKVCVQCDGVFETGNPVLAKFCGNTCAQRSFRAARRAVAPVASAAVALDRAAA